MMHNELKRKKTNTLKPQFLVADKWVDVKDIPQNAVTAHLDEQLAMRDSLSQELPLERIKTLKKLQQ